MRQIGKADRRKRRAELVLARRKKRRKKLLFRGFILTLVCLVALTSAELYKFLAVLNSFDNTVLSTQDSPGDTFGMLILGMDKDGGSNLDKGHTDSITYVAANLKTKKAYALPIYRDMDIPVSGKDESQNINRIYAKHGVERLASSVSEFLDLPVHNYVVITMSGFIDIIDAFGTVTITPEYSFGSRYGIDEDYTYWFEADEPQEVTADAAMAYVRWRAGGNGEGRANRQVEMIQAIKDRCLENTMDCYNKIAPHLSKALKTNIQPGDLMRMMSVFGEGVSLETLSVIEGRNVELSPGDWTEYPDEDDKTEKAQIIREEIFQSAS